MGESAVLDGRNCISKDFLRSSIDLGCIKKALLENTAEVKLETKLYSIGHQKETLALKWARQGVFLR